MRHQKHKNRLGVDPSHRKALIKNLASSIIEHGSIKTTKARAKATKSYVEKLVTKAKEDTVSNRRYVFSKLNNKDATKKLFETIAPEFKTRNGGYTRLIKLPEGRVGDNAEMSVISFVS